MGSIEEFTERLPSKYSTLKAPNIPENSLFYTRRTNTGGWLYRKRMSFMPTFQMELILEMSKRKSGIENLLTCPT